MQRHRWSGARSNRAASARERSPYRTCVLTSTTSRVDEAGVDAEHARSHRLEPALAGLVPAGAGDELGAALQVLVDLA